MLFSNEEFDKLKQKIQGSIDETTKIQNFLEHKFLKVYEGLNHSNNENKSLASSMNDHSSKLFSIEEL